MTERQKHKSIYWEWKAIKQRTLNPRCAAYKNYGARGITICEEWMDFEPFLSWALNNGWAKGLEIDRINNDAGYSPENCRYVTRRENLNNQRQTVRVTVDGVERPISEWADLCGIPHGSLEIWSRTKGKDYVAGRIKDALENGYIPCNYGHDLKPITNLSTGRRYESVKAAAKDVGLAPCTISNAMKRGGHTSKGYFAWEEA